jgi:hypothetical protein
MKRVQQTKDGVNDRYKAAIAGHVANTSEASAELIRERTAAVRSNRLRSDMLLAKARGELIEKSVVRQQADFIFVALRQKILALRK